MQVVHNEKFTLLSDFGDVATQLSSIKEAIQSLEKKHVVLLFSENDSVRKEDFLVFLEIAEEKRENGTSFVVISTGIDVDDFSDELNIVPTVQEAEDIIEMEKIERELGF